MSTDIPTLVLDDVRARFRGLKNQTEKALSQVPDEAWKRALSPDQNSIGILVKHIAGNIRSRFTDFPTSDGEKPDRNRDSEFVLDDADTADALRRRWEASWQTLFGELDALAPEDLAREVRIRGKAHTVLQALNIAHGHYTLHFGQIVFLAKHLTGDEWQTMSIPRAGSQTYFERLAKAEASK